MDTPTETQRILFVETPALVQWVSTFLTAKRAERKAAGTLAFYREKLTHFADYCAKRNVNTIEGITPGLLREYLIHLEETGHNAGGTHGHYRAVKVFLRWYEREEEPEGWHNPITKVRAPTLPEEPLDPADVETLRAIVAACQSGRMAVRDRAIVLTLFDCGLRASELLNLDLSDVNPYTGELTVRRGKGGKSRTVYMGQKTRRALRAYLKQRGNKPGPLFLSRYRGRLAYDGLRDIIIRAAKRAAVSPPSLHAFRRACALNLHRNGADLLTIQRVLGHADLTILRRYIKQTAEDLQTAQTAASPADNAGL
jgi:site-specific recombinase XerD